MIDPLPALARETAEKAYDVAKGGWPLDLEHVILAALRQAQQVQRERDAEIAATFYAKDGRVGTQSLCGERIADAIRSTTLRSQETP